MRAADMLAYHGRSKHRLDRYASGPGRLDWANQPDPFRTFAGASRTALPLAADELTTRFNDIRRGDLPPAAALERRAVGILFELSLGLSAWKSFGGNRWALRCNPSSGNLHPTEAYLACPALPGLAPGVHHYVSRDHLLERRAIVDDARWTQAFGGLGVIVGLTSIYWREAWKYGMRAWRYCQHDCGHAIAALAYAAAALGWQARILTSTSDDAIAALLGLDRDDAFAGAEREAADALLWIGPGAQAPELDALDALASQAHWSGRANVLSREHVLWPDIDSIHAATRKPRTGAAPSSPAPQALAPPLEPALDRPFATLARQRRSAVDFDGHTWIGDEALFAMLDALLFRVGVPPWNALDAPSRVHAALMVHRVRGLDPGLYMFVREPTARAGLQAAMRSEWLWRKAGPAHLPLFLLLPIDLRAAARTISCHQDIASDGCFALGMLASLDEPQVTPWLYPHLFREAGMLGQVLYLEAEAAGIRATGIGCYFDDEMHRLLGLTDLRWQSLYHFTVGAPLEDPRLSTLPPYPS